jgi:V/A-type H+-transporting ATPase subunit E
MKEESAPSKILQKEIREQSETEAAVIMEQAEKEAGRIIGEAESEARKIRSSLIKKAEIQAKGIRKRILSSVHLEIKKQDLQAREEMLLKLFQIVQEKLEQFRKSPDYGSFLEAMIIEGALALGFENLNILAGEIERKLLSRQSLDRIEKQLENDGRKVNLSLSDEKIDEGGIIVTSADGRARFDNRFSARIRRNQDEMRLLAIKKITE